MSKIKATENFYVSVEVKLSMAQECYSVSYPLANIPNNTHLSYCIFTVTEPGSLSSHDGQFGFADVSSNLHLRSQPCLQRGRGFGCGHL